MPNNKIRSDHPTYNGMDSTRGLDVIEFVHESKAHAREIAMKQAEKGALSHQMKEEMKKPTEFNWPEGKIPESGVSRSVQLRQSGHFDPHALLRQHFKEERAARKEKVKITINVINQEEEKIERFPPVEDMELPAEE